MPKKEATTDLWVHDLLVNASIDADAQGSTNKEIEDALKTASKKGTGKIGRPEYVAVVKDYVIVIEDKKDLSNHLKYDDKGLIAEDSDSCEKYAVNGAVHYAKHIVKSTNFKKVFAIGVSGDERRHKITPIFIDDTEYYRDKNNGLEDLESFMSLNEDNIDDYYVRKILKEETETAKEIAEILKDASDLHEDLRNYGNLKDAEKPLVVSGILLALREIEFKNFDINSLNGDKEKTDGQKIYDAINDNLKRAQVQPEVKKDKILSQFSFIKDTPKLYEIDERLGKSPLKYFTEQIDNKIYKSIRYKRSGEDYIGRFYSEFMSYSGGDGQTLGIILTPKHITELFCDLANLDENDIVFDSCCGTGGFLIAAMHYMQKLTDDEMKKRKISRDQLHGIELRPDMFTIATTNMILRGDGKSNLLNADFLKEEANKLQLKGATVGMMNPPYSQGSKQNPQLYELSFIEHLLDSLANEARCIVIVPQSSFLR